MAEVYLWESCHDFKDVGCALIVLLDFKEPVPVVFGLTLLKVTVRWLICCEAAYDVNSNLGIIIYDFLASL